MKKIFRKEVIIGLVVIFALAVLVIGIDFLKGVNVFKATNYYYSDYSNVEGLAVSAPVKINGFKVGQVRDISYNYDKPGKVRVEISIEKDLRIPEGTLAELSTDLLGTASINLKLAQSDKYLNIGSEITASEPKGLMANVTDNLLPSVEQIFPKIDTLLTSINTLVGDPALLASVKRLDAITANLERTTAQLNAVVATLPPITKDVKTITGNVSVMSEDLASLSGTMRNLPLDSIANDLARTTANLKELSRQLNDPNSSIGKLTHDPALYNNINSAISNLDSLFIDIKKNPKRYISIKLL